MKNKAPITDEAGASDPINEDRLDVLREEVRSLRQQLSLSQRLASIGTMTAMVAHEFNNILTPIINYAQLAKTRPELTTKAIDKAASGGLRAKTICKALLGMCSDHPSKSEMAIGELISETLAALARDPARDGIEVTVSAPEGQTISTRPVELQHVLLNLVMNARRAVKAKRGHRRIDVRAHKADQQWVIDVSDNGVGIAPEDMNKIFEPFFSTADPAKGDGGHGLGLPICRQIVKSLGGSISVDSAVGEGTTFQVRLKAA